MTSPIRGPSGVPPDAVQPVAPVEAVSNQRTEEQEREKTRQRLEAAQKEAVENAKRSLRAKQEGGVDEVG